MKRLIKTGAVLGLSAVILASCATKEEQVETPETTAVPIEQEVQVLKDKVTNLETKVDTALKAAQEAKAAAAQAVQISNLNAQKIKDLETQVQILNGKIDNLSRSIEELLDRRYRK